MNLMGLPDRYHYHNLVGSLITMGNSVRDQTLRPSSVNYVYSSCLLVEEDKVHQRGEKS